MSSQTSVRSRNGWTGATGCATLAWPSRRTRRRPRDGSAGFTAMREKRSAPEGRRVHRLQTGASTFASWVTQISWPPRDRLAPGGSAPQRSERWWARRRSRGSSHRARSIPADLAGVRNLDRRCARGAGADEQHARIGRVEQDRWDQRSRRRNSCRLGVALRFGWASVKRLAGIPGMHCLVSPRPCCGDASLRLDEVQKFAFEGSVARAAVAARSSSTCRRPDRAAASPVLRPAMTTPEIGFIVAP